MHTCMPSAFITIACSVLTAHAPHCVTSSPVRSHTPTSSADSMLRACADACGQSAAAQPAIRLQRCTTAQCCRLQPGGNHETQAHDAPAPAQSAETAQALHLTCIHLHDTNLSCLPVNDLPSLSTSWMGNSVAMKKKIQIASCSHAREWRLRPHRVSPQEYISDMPVRCKQAVSHCKLHVQCKLAHLTQFGYRNLLKALLRHSMGCKA